MLKCGETSYNDGMICGGVPTPTEEGDRMSLKPAFPVPDCFYSSCICGVNIQKQKAQKTL